MTEEEPVLMADAKKLKEEGNAAFKDEDWDKALACYTQAISLAANNDSEKAIYFKNRAAAYLKLNECKNAFNDCNAALEIRPNDPKALYRRSQALESLERYEEAYKDARQVHNLEPSNKAIQPALQRLHHIVQQRYEDHSQTSNKVSQMFGLVFDTNIDKEKRETAANNLLFLSRERAGAEVMMMEGIAEKIGKSMKTEKSDDIRLAYIRIIGELCKNCIPRTKVIVQQLGVPWFMEALNSRSADQINATQFCIQSILSTFAGMDSKEAKKPDAQLMKENAKEIDSIMATLVCSTTSPTIFGLARDAILETITKNLDYSALDWSGKLINMDGIQRMLDVASEMQDYKYESSMEITDDTQAICAVCLGKLYDNMYHDKLREQYVTKVTEYVKDKLRSPDVESKVRVTVAITVLLRGPVEVGTTIISREGVLEMMLVMAGTEDILQQKVASEAIIAASTKKDKVRAIIDKGTNILKKLYKSEDDHIKVRALVGLCKLSSSGGSDASIRPFAEGSTLKLAEACRRFLVNPSKDKDMRKWAAEGLSYLTLDAEVKEKLIEDTAALLALIELAKTGDQSVLYGVVTTLVNLVNAYDKEEVIPELVELAKFSKMHIPEEHELDDPDFIDKRVQVLAHAGVTSALVALAKTESQNSRELIARIFRAICKDEKLRGIVVQHGGSKVLISMALEGTAKGKRNAAQALARIGVTLNPEVAFPGQRTCEVIRPLIDLLHPDCDALQNFEALMALCNLAGVNETIRKRIIKEGGIFQIETYMYQDHLMLKRAAMQAMCNMMASEEVVKVHEGKNDRTKYIVLLCADEDLDTCKAAGGALAILTSTSKTACEKVFDTNQWHDTICYMLSHEDTELQHRGLLVVYNMLTSTKTVAEKIIGTTIMEVVTVLSKLEIPGKEKIKEYAEEILKAAQDMKLIEVVKEDTDCDLE